jgi:riboflavin kinase/FMN adenylyltransferase
MTRTLEAHIFGFEGNLYGQWVKVEWVARLRDVQRFESLEALRQQLGRDQEAALRALGGDGRRETGD